MGNTGKIISLNLIIFIAYTLLIHATTGRDAALTGSVFAYVHSGGIFLVGLIMAIFNKGKVRTNGGALILAGLLIAIIGFSVCLGTFSLKLH
jgi:hypothetical protein